MAKANTLVDNFYDNTVDTAKWNIYGNSPPERIREVNQRVEIRPGANTPGVYSGYESVAAYDLTNSEVKIEVVRALIASDAAQSGLQAKVDANNFLYIAIQAAQVVAFKVIGGSYLPRANVTYDPARHRWLRLRESSGITYWETSGDGAVWEVLYQEATPLNVTSVKINFGGGTSSPLPAPGVAIFDNVNYATRTPRRRLEERRLSARDVRDQAATVDAERNHAPHENNNDETNYPSFGIIGSFSKGLKHDATTGEPDAVSYASLLRALESRAPDDFEEVLLGTPENGLKLTNPQTGFTFDTEGPDAQTFTVPPAPRFDSVQEAHEMGELYWMAVARDVAFADYGSSADVSAAISSLNNEFPQFGGTTPVTVQNVFRGIFPGDQKGPFVSQLLLKGNSDRRKPAGGGRDAADGYISYGSQVIDQRQYTVVQGTTSDYMTTFAEWLTVQNGTDRRGNDVLDTTQRRFIRSLRDGA
ncbi:MAG TPA: hypothetical protein VFE05_12985, partial [Longimicrobiaceae bacterium]|nr:hypothetical protein [Longimicrobiaceae bacterium]